MPHLSSQGSEISFDVVDLKLEDYPPDQKATLEKAFSAHGLVGQMDDKLIMFTDDYMARVVTPDEAKGIEKLPDDWVSKAVFVESEALVGDDHISDDSEKLLEPAAVSESLSLMRLVLGEDK